MEENNAGWVLKAPFRFRKIGFSTVVRITLHVEGVVAALMYLLHLNLVKKNI